MSNLTINEVNSLSVQELFKKLDNETKQVLKNYDFYKFYANSLVNICIEAIKKSIDDINDNKKADFKDIYMDNLNNILSDYLKELFDNEKEAKRFIDSYIDIKFKSIKSYNMALTALRKLFRLLGNIGYEASVDLYTELVKNNNLLNNAIRLIFNRYEKQIVSNKYDDLFDIYTVILINIYCEINGIEINELDEEKVEENGKYSIQKQEIYYTDDSLKSYLREIGNIGMLSKEEERELAKKIYNYQIERDRLLEIGDVDGSEKINKKLELAKKRYMEANLRLVVSVAKRYIGRGVSLLDLIQEGNFGLMKAVDKYDYSLGFRFSTYAICWIRQAITRSLANDSRNIRLPVHVYTALNRMALISSNLIPVLGHYPTDEEIADNMGVTVSYVRMLKELKEDTYSLNNFINEDEDTEMIDFIVSENDDTEKEVFAKLSSENISKAYSLAKLTPKEEDVINKRLGLNGYSQMKLEEIGAEYNVTRERIRQIEVKALRKLRKPNVIALLKAEPSESTMNSNHACKSIYQLLSPNSKVNADKYGFPRLSQEEYQVLVDYAGGKDFTKVSNKKIDDVKMRQILFILEKVKCYIKLECEKNTVTSRKTLFEALPYTVEEIETYILPYLPEHDIDYLVRKSGSDDITVIKPTVGNITYSDKNRFSNIITKCMRRYKNGDIGSAKTKFSFVDAVGVKNSRLFIDLVELQVTDYEKSLIEKKCGTSALNSYVCSSRMSAKEIVDYYNIVKKYRNIARTKGFEFKPEFNIISVYDMINSACINKKSPAEVTQYIYNILNESDIKLLIWYSGGYDFTITSPRIDFLSAENANLSNMIYGIVKEVVRYINRDNKDKKVESNLYDILDYSIIDELEKFMSEAEAIILCLKAGFNNNTKCYSIDYICNTLNISDKKVEELFNSSIKKFENNKKVIMDDLTDYTLQKNGKIVKRKKP